MAIDAIGEAQQHLSRALGDETLAPRHAARISATKAEVDAAARTGDHARAARAVSRAMADETMPDKHAAHLRNASDALSASRAATSAMPAAAVSFGGGDSDSKADQTGPKGGKFYVTATGRKVYKKD